MSLIFTELLVYMFSSFTAPSTRTRELAVTFLTAKAYAIISLVLILSITLFPPREDEQGV